MSDETAPRAPFAPRGRICTIALAGLLAVKIALLFAFAWRTQFVMDEFVFLGNAKYLGHDFYHTIWPVKTVGYAVFFDLAHRLGQDAQSILLIGRVQAALLGCGTLALLYSCARGLGESRLRAIAILVIALSFSNLIERLFRTIAEPVSLFFAVAALLVVIRGRWLSPARIFMAGVLSGLAFLCTQKGVYFNAALGLALVADAALTRKYTEGIRRGAWLVLGWAVAVGVYCVAFGGTDALAVARSVFLGPVDIATHGGDAYPNLQKYVVQTLSRNVILYLFCFAGMGLSLTKVRHLSRGRRIALIFSIVMTVLVFLHNQPWPYVFIMALPFMALWALVPLDNLPRTLREMAFAVAFLGLGVALSLPRNAVYLQRGNAVQLEIVRNAEALLAPGETYFDGIAMLPNRREPSDLWLDYRFVNLTLAQGKRSEAYRVLSQTPPKVVIWSTRMTRIAPVVGPLIDAGYLPFARNIRLAGRHLMKGETQAFRVPFAGTYALYDRTGRPVAGTLELDGVATPTPVALSRGNTTVRLVSGAEEAWLLPLGNYAGRFSPRPDDPRLFAGVYD